MELSNKQALIAPSQIAQVTPGTGTASQGV